MLIKVTALRNWPVEADDGEVGSVIDVLFDDQSWLARYLVVRTGIWLSAREVLLPPASVRRPMAEIGVLHVDCTRAQIEGSPRLGVEDTVSRRYETEHALRYGYPREWAGPDLAPTTDERPAEVDEQAADETEARLCSAHELIGCDVHALDGDVGTLDDLAIEDGAWTIRDLIVDVQRWRPGGRVLVSTSEIAAVNWPQRLVQLRLNGEDVRRCPAAE